MKRNTSSRKVRYAVVGLGHIVQIAVLPAFKNTRNSELVALISGDAKKQSKMAEQYGVDRVHSYEEYEECLAKDVDAVYIGLPNHLHREFTVRAAESGIHVLCEKPMAPTTADCREMISAMRNNKRKLMLAYRLHFEAGNLEAVDLAHRGKLGDLRFFASDFCQQVAPDNVRVTEPVERGGGPVYDMGVYCINGARYLFQDEPIEVFATSASKGPRFKKTEEMTTAVLRFPGERLAHFTVSFGAADFDRYSLFGSKGALTANPGYGYSDSINLKIMIGEKTQKREFPKRDQFAAEIAYFSDCILKNKEPEPSGEEGLADVRIIEAIYESVRTGRIVRLPEFEKRQRPIKEQQIFRPPHGKPEMTDVKSPSGEAA